HGNISNNLEYDNNYILSTSAPLITNFNYLAVDKVTYAYSKAQVPPGSPESQFVLDNLAVTVPAPQPPTPSAEGSTLLTFDDLPGHCVITGPARVMNGYGGLLWGYAFYLAQNPNGMVSPTNVAYVNSGTDAYIYSPNFFDLNSAYLTAENVSGTQIRIQGMVGTNLTYDNTYTIKTNEPTLINFNYLGIDKVKFFSTGSKYFIDNVTVNISCAAPGCTS